MGICIEIEKGSNNNNENELITNDGEKSNEDKKRSYKVSVDLYYNLYNLLGGNDENELWAKKQPKHCPLGLES